MQKFVPDLSAALAHSPIADLVSLLLCLALNIQIWADENNNTAEINSAGAAGFSAGGAAHLFAEGRGWTRSVVTIFTSPEAILSAAVGYFALIFNTSLLFLFPALTVAAMIAGYLRKNVEQRTIWRFNLRLGIAALLADIVADMRPILGGIAVLLLIGATGPWGAYGLTSSSQFARLTALMQTNGLPFKAGPNDWSTVSNISNTLGFANVYLPANAVYFQAQAPLDLSLAAGCDPPIVIFAEIAGANSAVKTSWHGNYLAWIQNVFRIQGFFEQPHDGELSGIAMALQAVALFEADAMFGGNRTAHIFEPDIYGFGDLRAERRQRLRACHRDMKIAVTQMTNDIGLSLRRDADNTAFQ